jgi:hypothetical protein
MVRVGHIRSGRSIWGKGRYLRDGSESIMIYGNFAETPSLGAKFCGGKALRRVAEHGRQNRHA